MFLNKDSFAATLRFRIAAAYLILFMVLLLAGFAALYGYYAVSQVRQADANLSYQFAEYSAEYLTGEEYAGPSRPIRETDVPESIRTRILKANPGIRLVSFFSDGPMRYWIAGERNGEAFVFDLHAPSFAESARRLKPADRVGHMSFQFSDENHEVGARDSINILISQDGGKTLAATPVGAEIISTVVEAGLALRPGARGSVNVGESHWRIGKRNTFDGNVFVFAHTYDVKSMRAIALTGILCLVLTLVFGGGLSWILGGLFMRNLTTLIAASHKVRAGDYSVRLPKLNGGREIDALADSFNAMVEDTGNVVSDLRTISDNIAHDLKTPLTRLRGKAEMAFSSGDSAGLAEDVAEECASMLAMINAMLEIARVESGDRMARSEQVDIGAVASKVVELFSTLAEDRKIQLTLTVPGKQTVVSAQRVHVQRLFANLIDNALKFSPEGGRVAVAVATDGKEATIMVTDSGCGIDDKDLSHVFDRFYRSDRSRNIQGNGLGLSLVKAIATLYGGRVDIRSKLGEGTAVAVHLPALDMKWAN